MSLLKIEGKDVALRKLTPSRSVIMFFGILLLSKLLEEIRK